MKNKLLAIAAIAALPMQIGGYVAYAQSQQAVDPAMANMVKQVIRDNPEIIVEALQTAQRNQQQREQLALAERAKTVRADLAAATTPGLIYGNAASGPEKTIIEFLDYRCGYCKQVHTAVNEVTEQDDKARFVIMMRPILGPDSETLARFALAANMQGKFAQTNDYLYENSVKADDAGLEAAATALGLDWAKVRTDMTGDAVSQKLEEHRSFAEKVDVQGTPFFITPEGALPGAVAPLTLFKSIQS